MSDEVERIKEKLDLGEVIGEYVPLKKAGHSLKGLCPFHNEKTPSFVVTPDRGIWHCFGCGEGGDVFSFVQKVEGVDFVGSLKMLAERAGVELKQRSNFSKEDKSAKQRRFDVLDLTGRFYQELLLRQKVGKKALEYLKERGVELESLENFKLGYAPDRWSLLQQFLGSKGFKVEEMIAAGVVGKSERGKFYDRFRGRIIFPIRDVQGRVVALAGRITPWTETGTEGKYVNSPETDLYQKRRVVYNLDKAKQAIRRVKKVIVVEGYMDVIMLAQVGIDNVVASSGTAFSEEQVGQLKRFASTLNFAFDADAAGWKAGLAAYDVALMAGMRVEMLQFPSGKDPADVVLEMPDKLAKLMDNPVSLVRVALDRLGEAETSEVVQARLDEVLPLLAKVSDPVAQGEMVAQVAQRLHLPEARVGELLLKFGVTGLSVQQVGEFEETQLTPEYKLLGLVISDTGVRKEVFVQIEGSYLVDDESKELYKVLQDVANTHEDFFTMKADALLARLPDSTQALAGSLISLVNEQAAEESGLQEAQGVLRWMMRRSLVRRRDDLQRRLAEASHGDRSAILEEFQAVVGQLEKVKEKV